MAIERYEGPGPQLMREKIGVANDVDYTNPANALPADLGTVAWSMPGLRSRTDAVLQQILVTVTFRVAATGAEVAGTYDATAFAVLPRGVSGDVDASVRPKVQKLGAKVTQPSAEPMVVDVGRHEAFGVILTNINAPGADRCYITVEEWGG